jgi:hypothetical protein
MELNVLLSTPLNAQVLLMLSSMAPHVCVNQDLINNTLEIPSVARAMDYKFKDSVINAIIFHFPNGLMDYANAFLDISQILMVFVKEVDQTQEMDPIIVWLEITSIKIRKNVLGALKDV